MIETNFLQIVGVLLGIFFIYKSYVLVKNKKEHLFNFFLWVIIGVVLVVLSVNLDILNISLGFMNMTSKINLLFTASVLLSLFLIFMLFKEVKNIEVKISKLNEDIAISKYKRGKKSRDSSNRR